MELPFYDLVDVLVYDPVPTSRAVTRSALYSLGCRRIEFVTDLGDFHDGIAQGRPDLVVCEVGPEAASLCKLTQAVRQGSRIPNPFVLVLMTAWSVNSETVGLISNAGADDLILRPFSTSTLGQRIETLVSRSRRFIVNSNYIGPERRKPDQGRVSDAITLETVNSIQIKAQARYRSEDIASQVDSALQRGRLQLSIEKLCCDTRRLLSLGRGLLDTPAGTTKRQLIEQMVLLVTAMDHRAQDAEIVGVRNPILALRAALASVQAETHGRGAIEQLEQAGAELLRHIEHAITTDAEQPHIEAPHDRKDAVGIP